MQWGIDMPRNRMIKATFWVEEAILSCSQTARLLFIGMWNFCDDAGIHPASLLTLKAEIFPTDTCSLEDVKRWIGELVCNDLIREYSVKGRSYWIVNGWQNRQKINRPTPSHYPAPESGYKQVANLPKLTEHSVSTQDIINEEAMSSHGSLKPNKKEEKEKEREKKKIGEVETSLCSWDREIPSDCEFEISPDWELDTSPCSVIASNDVQKVFKYWRDVMGHSRAKLDDKRRKAIERSLKKLRFTVEQLMQAIDGCVKTPHNMGDNDRHQRYDDIELILRDASHIERFMRNAINPPTVSIKPNSEETDIMAGVIFHEEF